MRRTTLVAAACAMVLAATSTFAHHSGSSLGTVRLDQAVKTGDVTLQPGLYELRDTGDHLKALPGQSAESMVWIEFVQDGKVVARDGADLVAASARAVGTGGTSRLRVERLKDNEFIRISTYHEGSRYLIHLMPVQR